MASEPLIPIRGIALNTALSLSTKIAGIVLGFFSLGLTTRFLGQAGFGVYSTVLAYASIVSFLGDFGLYSLMVREISRIESREEEGAIASNIFTMRIVGLVVFFALGIAFAPLLPHKGALPLFALFLASLQYLALSIAQVLVAIFQKYLNIAFVAVAELAGRGLTLGALMVAITYTRQVSDASRIALALTAFALGSLVIAVVSFWGTRRLVRLRLRVDFKAWKQLLAETLPMGIAVVVTAIYFRVDTILLAFLRSDAEVGIYNGAYRILDVLTFFPAAFVGLLMPRLSRYAVLDGKRFSNVFQGGFEALLMVTFPISAGLLLEAKPIVSFIAGKEFLASGLPLAILSGAVFMIFFGSLFSNALIAKKQQWPLAYIYIFGMIVNIGANLFVIPRWGYVGAAWTTLLTEGLATLLMLTVLWPISVPWRRLASVLFSTALMALFLRIAQVPLAVAITGGAALYMAGLLLSGGLNKQDVAFILEPPIGGGKKSEYFGAADRRRKKERTK